VGEEIKFASEQGWLTIKDHGYERSSAEDQDDANWLKCEVSLKVGPFSDAFNAAFTTYDLVRSLSTVEHDIRDANDKANWTAGLSAALSRRFHSTHFVSFL
jgi:hypothetical protein